MKRKRKIVLCFIFFTGFFFVSGQTSYPSLMSGINVTHDSLTNQVEIKFDAIQEISSLVVLVFDNIGNTLFLDSRHRLKGQYKQTIDLSDSGKGHFILNIMCDDEKQSKKLIIR